MQCSNESNKNVTHENHRFQAERIFYPHENYPLHSSINFARWQKTMHVDVANRNLSPVIAPTSTVHWCTVCSWCESLTCRYSQQQRRITCLCSAGFLE